MSLLLRSKFRSPEYHTPFCLRKNCSYSHHDLVKVLNCRHEHISGEIPIAVKKLIQFHTKFGWSRDSGVPEHLKELRCPLLFLACAFGKASFVEGLLQNNFNACVTNHHGETCLHAAAGYMYCRMAMMGTKLKVVQHLSKRSSREKAFERILQALTNVYPKILAATDNNGRTPLHSSAANILERFRFGEFHKRAVFFRFCIQSMIRRLLKLEAAGIFTRSEVLWIVKSPEYETGDTVLHMLARDRPYGFETLKFIIDLLFPGNLPYEKNKENKTVFNIAWETNADGALELFFSGRSEEPEQKHQEQQQQLLQQCYEGTPSSSDAVHIDSSNPGGGAKNAGQIVVDIDIVKTEGHLVSDSDGYQSAGATGNPFPKVIVTSYQPYPDPDTIPAIPAIPVPSGGGVSSVSCEVCAAIEKAFVSKKFKDLVPGAFVAELFGDSCSTSGNQGNDDATMSMSSPEPFVDSDSEESESEFSSTQTTGAGNCSVNGTARQRDILLKHWAQELCKVKTKLSETKQLRRESHMNLKVKKLGAKCLDKQLISLRKEIKTEEKNLEELKKKEFILCKSRRSLKEKVANYKELKKTL